MEYLKDFQSLYDNEDEKYTAFKIVTNDHVYKVKWHFVDVPTERNGMYIRQYSNDIRSFCRERYISITYYEH